MDSKTFKDRCRTVTWVSTTIAVATSTLCLVDLFGGGRYAPFGGQTFFDVALLIVSALIVWMCRDMWGDFDLGDSMITKAILRREEKTKRVTSHIKRRERT